MSEKFIGSVPQIKLATNLEAQFAWLAGEMGYSRDKTKGFEEKLDRLSKDPNDPQSVFRFMEGYWRRFQVWDSTLADLPEPIIVSKALQAQAKVVAGLSDKVALTFWLEASRQGLPIDHESYTESALALIAHSISKIDNRFENRLALIHQPFEANPMGQAATALHDAFRNDPSDIAALRAISLKGSTGGLLVWQAYAEDLGTRGFDVAMPKPGLSSGTIEPW